MSSTQVDSMIVFDLDTVVDVEQAMQDMAANWGWILAEGIMNCIFGVLALSAPILATAYAGLYAHSALVVAGIINISGLIFAERGFKIRSLVLGVFQFFLGGILEYYPLESLVVVTIAIATLIMVDGMYRIVLADRNRDLPGWFWTVMGGVVSVISGLFVLATLPTSSLDTIGTLVGMHLLSVGPIRIKIARLGRQIAIKEKED